MHAVMLYQLANQEESDLSNLLPKLYQDFKAIAAWNRTK